jgi:RimJ/RimL family protein N-acetyltransferase
MTSTTNYSFTSHRLGYRPIRKDDLNDLLKLESDPRVRAFLPTKTVDAPQLEAKIEKEVKFHHEKKFGIFIAIELRTDEIVGRCGFTEMPTGEIEAGYVFFKKFWGQGLASEALSALLEWAEKNIDTDKITALAPISHVASHRVMEKSGMHHYKNDTIDGIEYKCYKKELSTRQITTAEEIMHESKDVLKALTKK